MLNIEELKKLVEEKYVNVQKHPHADLFIYNYGPRTQYERLWNETTLQCRGLILDKDYNVVARPFRKFFNLEELPVELVPETNFEVYDKLDGSLGIVYFINDKPYVATRGSFTSPQSQKANEILNSKYAHVFDKLDKSNTYLLEILFPENRIVCRYDGLEDLILLAIIDTQTGEDRELEDIGFPIVKRYDGIKDIKSLKALEEDNKEGFVVKFQNNFRLKIKFEEYCRLHRILTNVSNRTVWEYLAENRNFDELLDRVPDEFYSWLNKTKNKILSEYSEIETYCKDNFKSFDNRKDAAEYYKNLKHTAVLFKMLDNKDYSQIIWKMLRPAYEKPFALNLEE